MCDKCPELSLEVNGLRDQSNQLIRELLATKQVVKCLEKIKCLAIILKTNCRCDHNKPLIQNNEHMFADYRHHYQQLKNITSDEAIIDSIITIGGRQVVATDDDTTRQTNTEASKAGSVGQPLSRKSSKQTTRRPLKRLQTSPKSGVQVVSGGVGGSAQTLITDKSDVILCDNGFRCGRQGCEFECRRRNTIDRHIRIVHCQPPTVTSGSVAANDRPFQCNVNDCRNAFRSKEHLRQHKLSLHPEVLPDVPWICCLESGCNYRTKSSNVFFKHKRSHTLPFQCHLCDRRFATPKPLEVHIGLHSGIKHNACPHCPMTYGPRKSLMAHIQRRHSHETYPCDEPDCGKQFASEPQLRQHRLRVHDSTYIRPVPCIWVGCDRRFETNAQMEDHLNKHTGDRFHVCGQCSHSFATKADLYSHMSNQHKDRPYACQWPDCTFKAAFMSRLRTHQKRHELQLK